jgi:hypothetical protein
VTLDSPITVSRYAQLPAPGLADTLRGDPVTVVGYGVQGFEPAAGGRSGFSNFTRTQAELRLQPSNHAWRDQFLRLSASKAAVCFGDSGGPVLVGDTIVGIVSYTTQNCSGASYAYRLDTASAASFIP